MGVLDKDRCSFQWISSASCRNISFASLREGDGSPDPSDGSRPDFVWKREWPLRFTPYPDPYCDDPLDPGYCDDLPDEPGRGGSYWETAPFELHTQFPFSKINEIRITPEYIKIQFIDCQTKYAALKLYPEGSQIIITFNGNSIYGYNPPNQTVPEYGDGSGGQYSACDSTDDISSAACFYFLANGYYYENDLSDVNSILLPINQFQQIQTDCSNTENEEECRDVCDAFKHNMFSCSAVSGDGFEFDESWNYYEFLDAVSSHFYNYYLTNYSGDCDCVGCGIDYSGDGICEEDNSYEIIRCICDCANKFPGTELGLDEFGLPPIFADVHSYEESRNTCMFALATTIRVCRRSTPFPGT